MSKKIKRQRNTRTLHEKIQEALKNRYDQSRSQSNVPKHRLEDLANEPRRVAIVENQRKVYNQKQRKFQRRVTQQNTTRYVVDPKEVVFPVPAWFSSDGSADVSVVVPMFRSADVIAQQIESWDLRNNDGLIKEIIYVDDACPNKSHIQVLKSWEKRRSELRGRRVGRIVLHNGNAGFGIACNNGAKHSSGRYLLFLNADCVVTPNWIKPMIQLMEDDPEIGMVGNMQLRTDGAVDSCGSEWCWDSFSFQHIGRTIHNGKALKTAYKLNNLPADLREPGQREMVTGCCFAMPSKLFFDLQGFDPAYRKGYWEDSDLSMKTQASGYKVYFTPESKIYHHLGHSKAGGHPYMRSNREVFKKRWVDTGRINEFIKAKKTTPIKSPKDNIRGKVIGCVIALNEEEFLEVSVDSVASVVDEWYFVIGGNSFAHKAGMCTAEGYPTDNTLEIAHKLAKKYNGKVIEPPGRLWKDKIEMRNAYAKHILPGQWMFMLDGDEVYKPDQLWRVTELMREYECLIMQFWVFWNNVNTVGTGSWEKYPQERVVRWKTGYNYAGGNHLHVSCPRGLVRHQGKTWQGDEKLFYHYSWVRPIEKIRQKLEYYKHQSGINNQQYVDEIFLKWREDPQAVQGKTHPKSNGNWELFKGIHPEGVQKLIDAGKLNF